MITKENLPVAGVSGAAGVAVSVVFYLITNNVFVTPEYLEAREQRILREVAQTYATNSRVEQLSVDINRKLDLLLERLDKKVDKY